MNFRQRPPKGKKRPNGERGTKILTLLKALREWYGREYISPEIRIRTDVIRSKEG